MLLGPQRKRKGNTMDQTEQMAKLRALITESAEVAPMQPAAAEDNANTELQALMKKYGVLEEGGCNMTAEGEDCPVHGLEECGGYMEEQADEINEAYINNADDAIKVLGNLRAIGKKIELGTAEHEGNLANEYANDVWDVYSWLENKVDKSDPKFKSVMDPVLSLRAKAKGLEREPGSGKNRQLGNEIVNTLYPLMQWIEANVKHKVNESKKKAKPDFLDVDKDGDKKEPMKKALKDKEEKKVDEGIHIEVDGAEAAMFINRMAELAGSAAHVGSDVHADMCHGCGSEMDQCTCDDVCVDCGCADCECDTTNVMPMENADHDYGHAQHTTDGEPIDPETASWHGRYAPGTQSYVKGGDNPLIKEDADLLFSKLTKDYKAYIAEAELARSNAGENSPLTANNRDEFDKDPFAGEDPVIDGTHSPLSTVKRQHVAK